jgi:hypothetical protein
MRWRCAESSLQSALPQSVINLRYLRTEHFWHVSRGTRELIFYINFETDIPTDLAATPPASSKRARALTQHTRTVFSRLTLQ